MVIHRLDSQGAVGRLRLRSPCRVVRRTHHAWSADPDKLARLSRIRSLQATYGSSIVSLKEGRRLEVAGVAVADSPIPAQDPSSWWNGQS